MPAADPGLRGVIAAAEVRLEAAGVPSPKHDAEELAAYLLGTTRTGLPAAAVPAGFPAAYETLVARRAAREPLQHLTGVAYFRYLALAVGPGVFIPRPETEVLVDLALAALDRATLDRAALDRASLDHAVLDRTAAEHAPAARAPAEPVPTPVVIDLFAGSGAVGLALATERPRTEVHAVEADNAALTWLCRNVDASAPRVTVHATDVRRLLPALAGRVDLVTANPPYLRTGAAVEPEVARFDPPVALWGGPDGLEFVRVAATRAAEMLRPGGTLVLEHDASHQPTVVELLQQSGFVAMQCHTDLAGRPRFVSARRVGDSG